MGFRSDIEKPLKLLTQVQFEGQLSLVHAAALAMMQDVLSCVWSGVRMEVLRCRKREHCDRRLAVEARRACVRLAGDHHEHAAVYHRSVLEVETDDAQIGG
jgi:hypothetical protein